MDRYPQEVFYLTISDVMGIYESTYEPSSLRGLIAERKLQESSVTNPPDCYETHGEITLSTHLTSPQTTASSDSSEL
ncbi:MAG: hypothetical protein ABGY95_06255, partial [Rubritalea sp.]|uniref:hypothetical protein n=1 Tax=Rubritalea sp. TaxID=2109375 RepID=UPI003242BF72